MTLIQELLDSALAQTLTNRAADLLEDVHPDCRFEAQDVAQLLLQNTKIPELAERTVQALIAAYGINDPRDLVDSLVDPDPEPVSKNKRKREDRLAKSKKGKHPGVPRFVEIMGRRARQQLSLQRRRKDR